MFLTTLKFIDWSIIVFVIIVFITAIVFIILNKKKGKSVSCSNCPLVNKCHNKKECEKKKI